MVSRIVRALGIAIFFLSVSAWAESGLIFSVMAQKQSLSISQKGTGIYSALNEDDSLETDVGLGLGFGVGSMDGSSRFLIEFNGLEVEDTGSMGIYVAGWEKFFPLSSAPAVRPFAGISAGLGTLEMESGYLTGLKADDDARFVYGVSAGLQFELNRQTALEFRARYLQTGLSLHLENALSSANAVDFDVDSSLSLSGGVSWHF